MPARYGVPCARNWFVVMPRRPITGKLVRGKVWRRRDKRRCVCQRFVE
jgi:hypothetical protein